MKNKTKKIEQTEQTEQLNPLTIEKYQEQADKIISLINSGEDLNAYIMLSQNTHLIKGEDPYIPALYIKSLYQELLLDGYKERAKSLISVLRKNNSSFSKLIKSRTSIEIIKDNQSSSLESISEKYEKFPEEEQTAAICEGRITRRSVRGR